MSLTSDKMPLRDRGLNGLVILMIGTVTSLASCANVPVQQGVTLSSYDGLKPANGAVTKTRIKVDAIALAAARTIKIEQTTVSPAAAIKIPDGAERSLTANAIDRALCVALSDRFEVVAANQPADLTVRASITNILPTNTMVAGVSVVTSLGSSAVLPVSIPRLPIGLGGLGVEAEAMGSDGAQKAAMIWARGADSITTSARMSPIGDAYALAESFGDDFGKMLTLGKSPFGGMGSLPSGQKIWSRLGGKTKYAACESFGRSSGLTGAIGAKLGAPPGWTDKKRTADSRS
ncbi:DUF3313 domain-containing protein [Agrobacterium sp. rho-13.3]|jgi:hypothetical protein|uniref:DUF3313 domain-containing protein n=1 Tax=Agrobacterium sp. rho-13.3 TaxID=3072980 RepID=UPI002A17CA04|nr:DUF3313 domain-containing protein [Agrobacterium sp. rho-13.3]MDX8309259.1 DUF3313 domain-containing protein [Agrobacterium sp. rho-13.3]